MDRQDNIRKKTFTVPNGYFERLNKDILGATAATPRRSNRNHVIGRFTRIAGYAAAVATLFIVASNVLTSNKADEIAATAQSEYIDNILNSYTIDDYTFYCYLTESDFE